MRVQPDQYLSHFALTEEPFGAPANPQFLFRGEVHEEAMAVLELGIATRRGLVVIVGDVGTGKTTVAKALIEAAGTDAHVAYISNSTQGFLDLLREAFDAWGIPRGRTKGEMIAKLRVFATECSEKGETVALIVDEAQALSDGVLEELRQLLNLETTRHKLVQVILLGQPELENKLERPRLRHVADRVAMRCRTRPLTSQESHGYIHHRVDIAGGDPKLFSARARSAIVRAAGGVPRAINAMCHNALLFAFARGLPNVDLTAARQAIAQRADVRSRRRSLGRRMMQASLLMLVAVTILVATLSSFRVTRDPDGEAELRREPGQPAELPGILGSAAPRPAALGDSDGAPSESAEGSVAPTDPMKTVSMPTGRTIEVEPGDTLSGLAGEMYGGAGERYFALVAAANPQLASLDRLMPGDQIYFPALPTQNGVESGLANP